RGDAQGRPQRRVQFGGRARAMRPERAVQLQLPAQSSVRQLGAQRRLARVQRAGRAQRSVQGQVGERAALLDAQEHLRRQPAPRLTIRRGRPDALAGFPGLPERPLEALREALGSIECDRPDALPPFCGGFVGYLGWAAASWTEKLPQRLGPDSLFPEADLLYVKELVAFDHRQGRAW